MKLSANQVPPRSLLTVCVLLGQSWLSAQAIIDTCCQLNHSYVCFCTRGGYEIHRSSCLIISTACFLLCLQVISLPSLLCSLYQLMQRVFVIKMYNRTRFHAFSFLEQGELATAFEKSCCVWRRRHAIMSETSVNQTRRRSSKETNVCFLSLPHLWRIPAQQSCVIKALTRWSE